MTKTQPTLLQKLLPHKDTDTGKEKEAASTLKLGACYYVHSKQIWHTPREAEELAFLTMRFRRVCNPAQIIWMSNVADPWRRYFEAMLLCDMVVASEYQGFIGKGAWTELDYARQEKLPRFVLRKTPSTRSKNCLFRLIPIDRVELVDPEDWTIRYAAIYTKGDDE